MTEYHYGNLQIKRTPMILIANFLIYLAFFCAFMEKFTFYFRGEWYFDSGYTMTSPYLSYSRIFGIVAFCLFILTVAITILQKKHFYGLGMFLIITSCLVWSLFWSIHAYFEGVSPARLIFLTGSPLVFLYVLYFWLGMQENFYKVFSRCCKIVAPVALILTLYYEFDFATQYGFSTRATASPIYIWFQIGLFASVYTLFSDNNQKNKWYEWICVILAGWAGVLTGSRSYLILSMIFIYFFLSKRFGKKPFSIKAILVFTFVLVVLIISMEGLFVDTYNLYLSRLNEDTRTGQYNTFLDQVSLGNLLIGGGILASYSYAGISNYVYFDNQIILLMFRYGVVGVILYEYVILKTMFSSMGSDKSQLWIILLLWELALFGLSVYFPIDTGLMHVIVLVAAGRIHTLNLKRKMKISL
ncbi:hypothetical protein ABLO26_25865 [Neobacillus sp. 179-J 1A1 HS]|uniref:hypothetical protein n=1 Tax=Neobacillus driksii TaxID=3035913 RepID=UPI0035BC59A0